MLALEPQSDEFKFLGCDRLGHEGAVGLLPGCGIPSQGEIARVRCEQRIGLAQRVGAMAGSAEIRGGQTIVARTDDVLRYVGQIESRRAGHGAHPCGEECSVPERKARGCQESPAGQPGKVHSDPGFVLPRFCFASSLHS